MTRKMFALSFLATAMFLAQTVYAQQAQADWKPVETALGRSGKPQPDGTFKFSMPRKDLKVAVNGVAVKAGLALGSWAAFKTEGSSTILMGDLVLTQDEAPNVMTKLQAGGIDVTALHNHLLHESPRVMYMHIEGKGDAVKLATALHDALAVTRTPAASAAPAAPPKTDLDVNRIDETLGRKGKANNGIYQVSVPRAEKIMDEGVEIPPSMGVATSLNFQPLGNGRAAITGDFVLIGSEVDPVIATLRASGIQVTAVHSHMLMEEPRLFFLHFWATDDAVKLAEGLRMALDKTNSKK